MKDGNVWREQPKRMEGREKERGRERNGHINALFSKISEKKEKEKKLGTIERSSLSSFFFPSSFKISEDWHLNKKRYHVSVMPLP